MRELPILFSGPLVRAILEGTKTITRRPMKPQPVGPVANVDAPAAHRVFAWHPTKPVVDGKVMPVGTHRFRLDPASQSQLVAQGCRYGQAGDRLWVRETLRRVDSGKRGERWVYGADDTPIVLPREDPRVPAMLSWAHHKEGDVCTSIHMPRWASRILLEVTDVRVERLQDLTEEDAKAEGVTPFFEVDLATFVHGRGAGGLGATHRKGFARAWDEIYGAGSWAASPWVWRIAFRRLDPQ